MRRVRIPEPSATAGALFLSAPYFSNPGYARHRFDCGEWGSYEEHKRGAKRSHAGLGDDEER